MFSIIIAARNERNHLRPLLLSLLAQPEPDRQEIIVVDDASTDGMAATVSDLACRIIRLPQRCGPAAARNRGVAESRHELLVFLDADTVVAPGFLAAIALELRDPRVAGYICGIWLDGLADTPWLTRYKQIEWGYQRNRDGLLPNRFSANGAVIRRELFVSLGGFNEIYTEPSVEDFEFAMRLPATALIRTATTGYFLHRFGGARDILGTVLPRAYRFGLIDGGGTETTYAPRRRAAAVGSWIFLAALPLLPGGHGWGASALLAGLAIQLAGNLPLYVLARRAGGLRLACFSLAVTLLIDGLAGVAYAAGRLHRRFGYRHRFRSALAGSRR